MLAIMIVMVVVVVVVEEDLVYLYLPHQGSSNAQGRKENNMNTLPLYSLHLLVSFIPSLNIC